MLILIIPTFFGWLFHGKIHLYYPELVLLGWYCSTCNEFVLPPEKITYYGYIGNLIIAPFKKLMNLLDKFFTDFTKELKKQKAYKHQLEEYYRDRKYRKDNEKYTNH